VAEIFIGADVELAQGMRLTVGLRRACSIECGLSAHRNLDEIIPGALAA
jgi:hypothetical protein